jgi:DNA-binding response OmpR family regulator
MNSKPKVLVVDDEDLTLEFLQLLLSPKFEVQTCSNVKQFYSLTADKIFDIVLMDVFLRDSKDGIELTRELKMKEKFKDIPVFILSAQNSTKDRMHALDAGAHSVLYKPVDSKFLVKCMQEALCLQITRTLESI